jgi:hypothetical protein
MFVRAWGHVSKMIYSGAFAINRYVLLFSLLNFANLLSREAFAIGDIPGAMWSYYSMASRENSPNNEKSGCRDRYYADFTAFCFVCFNGTLNRLNSGSVIQILRPICRSYADCIEFYWLKAN